MTSLTPCRRCHRRETCQKRADTLASLRGLGITRANVRCTIPEEDFPVGTAVTVKAFELTFGGWHDDGWRKSDTVRRGTVVGWSDKKATVVLDQDQEIAIPDRETPISYLRAEPDRLTAIPDAPKADLCECGNLTKDRCEAKDFPMRRDGSDWFCQRIAYDELVYT